MPTCDKCNLCKGVKSVCMPCEGLADNGIVLAGEAPGALEDQEGRPFVGDAGVLQKRVLKRVKLERKDLGIINACRCKPPGNRTPTKAEIMACREYLVADIQRLKPTVVVPMGNSALMSTLGLTGIMKARGSVLTSEEFPGVFFLPTIHPAKALRRWEDEKTIEHDLRKAKEIAEAGGYEPVPVKYEVCHSVDEIRFLFRSFTKNNTRVAFDTETTGFDYWKDKIFCLSFSCKPGEAFVVPLYGKDMREIWSQEELQEILLLLGAFFGSDVPKEAQNGVFDILMLRGNFGIEVKNWVFDTMLCHHLVDENQPHGLDFIGGWYTDVDPYKKDLKKSIPRGGNYSNAPEEIVWNYAASDADVTRRSAVRLEAEAEQEDLMELHDRIMIPLAKVLAEAEWDGIHIDMDELCRIDEGYRNRYNQLLEEVYEIAGGKFNVNSHKQKARVLYDKLGLPVVKVTGAGNRSVDADTLQQLAKEHPIAQKLIEHGSVVHDINTYLKGEDGKSGLLKYIHDDGRVHPRWMLHRAVTGRLASSDPNVQSIKRPERKEESDISFRRMFAATEGWTWMGFDYKSMEAFVAGYVAPDERMIEMHRNKEDVHRLVASQMFRCSQEEVTKQQREQAKGVVFGLNYGRGFYSLAAEFGITVEQAKAYIESYFTLFEGIRKHFDNVNKMVNEDNYVVTPFKRRRHLYGVPNLKKALERGFFSRQAEGDAKRALAEMYRMAVNFTIQSPANDILGLACIRISERFRKYNLKTGVRISLHDAWYGECPDEELEDSVAIVKEELERPVPEMHNASFETDVKLGRFWGDDSIHVRGIN